LYRGLGMAGEKIENPFLNNREVNYMYGESEWQKFEGLHDKGLSTWILGM